jgi:hypothetical protein
MKTFLIHLPIKKTKDESIRHKPVTIQEPPHNTSEGSEFIDDAIRMKDQPLMRTEESVAAGSPENLW